MSSSGIQPQPTRPLELLLVEDDDDDVRLLERLLQRGGWHLNLSRVRNGLQALEYIRGLGSYRERVRPDLVFLDLNMPLKDGREVLKELKSDPTTQDIPVIVLTTSDDEQDIALCYASHANSYLRKPVKLARYEEMMEAVSRFWFTTVQLPPSA